MTPLRDLLDYRVVIVTGKGGTGKTTVAASLADAARRAGRRVLLAETASTEAIAGCFEPHPEPLNFTGRDVRPGLHAVRIEPKAALAEYLGSQLRIRALATRVIETETFSQLLESVPGWRELIILGKIWHFEHQQDKRGRPLYDNVIVDAPATGHGLTFLDVPRVVQQAVRAGPLHRHASWVEELVHDRNRTLLLPVTLPEELPVLETRELVERARSEIDIGVDRIVVNGLPNLESKSLIPIVDAIPPETQFETLPPPKKLRALFRYAGQREALAQEQRFWVSEACRLPVIDLPFVLEPACGHEEASPLSRAIIGEARWPSDPYDSDGERDTETSP